MRLLPQGTVIFEDISIEQFEGTVVKVIPKVPTKNQASRPKFHSNADDVYLAVRSNAETVNQNILNGFYKPFLLAPTERPSAGSYQCPDWFHR